MTPAQQAKADLWRQQHAALEAPAYRISLVSRSDGKRFSVGKGRGTDGPHSNERLYSSADIEAMIPFCSARNANNYDIYVTPVDNDHHYIVVDDMTQSSYADLVSAGYTPCLVIASSPANFQAILKTPREDNGRIEQSAAHKVMKAINWRVGDRGLSAVIHPFRIAGYSNRKPGKDRAFVRLIDGPGGECHRTAERLEIAREQLAAAPDKPTPQPVNNAPQTGATAVSADDPVAEWRWRIRNQAAGANWSAVDFGVARGMFDCGWPREAVEQAMIAASPNIETRHPHTADYARRTLDAVIRIAGRR